MNETNFYRGQVWRHKHRDIRVSINATMGSDVQVMNHEKTYLRWISQRGLLRDYTPDVAFRVSQSKTDTASD